MAINKNIKNYIENNILTQYDKNDLGHGLNHIYYVIKRSLKFAEAVNNININMVYVTAAFHDIGYKIDAKNHEIVSSKLLLEDKNLKHFFNEEQIKIMSEAVCDHRASSKQEPRSIYGKIVSSADRNTSVEVALIRTFNHKIKNLENYDIDNIIEECKNHIENKFGKDGYANKKIYFEDEEFNVFLEKIANLLDDNDRFIQKFIEVNNLEYEYFTKNVDEILKNYIEKEIFPKYELNDKAHGIIHIKEVIKRSFVLNNSLNLNLNPNLIYAISACHDLGKYINHEIHEKIAADLFDKDDFMKHYFSKEENKIIKQAIEDHRSSFEDIPRSIYGKLISSADRNSSIKMVFIRSFFVAKTRMPEMNIEDYLEYTHKRLSKRYNEQKPENMFFADEIYKNFLQEMRSLLKNKKEFKNIYCKINSINSRKLCVKDY